MLKFHDDRTQNEGALGFFRRASPSDNNNNNNNKISRDWGPVSGPKILQKADVLVFAYDFGKPCW
jgi:hypothetical protein